ncbi:MAG: TIGR01458 family HAD-type hydrolase [Gemmatimonadales bacterium]|nr:TIGR01458 family HAD-type hydrolase [Gemmatimonadales bacterium]
MPSAFLLDLDGTLYTEGGPIPGAVEVLASMRGSTPFRCVTNTSSRSRAAILERLHRYGFDIGADDVFTAVLAGAGAARSQGATRLAPFVAEAALPDLQEFELGGGTSGRPLSTSPDAVLIGDLGDRWTYALMQEAFRYLMDGALFIALSRDRYWMRRDGLALDAGPFVVGLEYATGATATIAGKPSPEFFHGAVRSLGVGPEADVVMIGDDIWTDIQGAQRAGYQGWLVQTGKYRADKVAESGVVPERTLPSVAELLA